MRKINILNVGVHAQRFDDAAARLLHWSQEPTARRYVCTCPVYTLMVTQELPEAHTAITGADMVTADGMPIAWVQRWRGVPYAERCHGPGLMRAVCKASAGTGIRHYLWGGAEGVPEALEQALHQQYGDVNVVGAYSPPFEAVGTPPNPEHIERINAAKPDIVWVGLGSPKQDVWMHLYREHLDAPLLIGVGAAFDFISGRKRQAPEWMGEMGLEWSFRLMQEPRRLGRRYLKYNSLFVWQVLREGEV
jgi:N-acetylglucosaminyldiphosphoundecaprenol N-acetyl-beta-D-mannosaminyltransferase